MSEPKCPGCGAGVRPWCDESEPTEDRLFWCGRLERVIKGRMWDVIESETCRRRQLAQAKERIGVLEQVVARLRAATRQVLHAWQDVLGVMLSPDTELDIVEFARESIRLADEALKGGTRE